MTARQYIEHEFFTYLTSGYFDKKYAARWVPADELDQILESALNEALVIYGYTPSKQYADLLATVKEKLQPVLQYEGDEFTGEFAYIPIDKKDEKIRSLLVNNPVGDRLATLGDGARDRAFREVARREGWSIDDVTPSADAAPDQTSFSAPASNRIVSFSDNQIAELDAQVTDVIDAVAAQNQIGGEAGLRELILGQLKAGRELIRAGSVRLYLLELALVEALKLLAAKYEKEVIGALASTLLTAIANHVGIA